ncbi:isocitrate dehydrogenase [Methanobrevibacter arboriphilus]|jgi:3-isopropylmalate dehydrogenase|uniref:isocitrate/isopropylmalate family dehydrogenase n=1 Tax=Methanobrevibacter arboriphilus TaxID=39441 RepID=UPI0022EEB63B|nr:isocitrate/isopropylmalate family dehydrogenase [Methanobrevibacter arboriphilus]MCC7561818.1 NAD-dependent isocitrate dehydrogenase [Methanobrevibacter arboriphilus]GLI11778.1 isocitrate dehydrogenase [Methanobrevibacter arboriphilus]
MYKIAVIPGDGIGKEVMEATLNILKALNIDFDFMFADAGDECKEKTSVALPDKTIEIVKKADACLFGAAGETAADVIVRLRQEMDLFANLRPVKSYPGTNSLFDDLDFMIVRENTEGMYIGDEDYIKDELGNVTGATAKRVITRDASERICEYAFKYAKENNRKKVTGIHKANVLKKTDGLFKKIFYEVAKKYKTEGIESEDFYVDATAMYLLTRPKSFDVIVTTNLFGDILSDEGAGLVGGLGLIPSANIGEDRALFEPVHGSAPDIAGKGLANPVACILSAVMMLEYLDEKEAANAVDKAVLKVLSENKTVTGDLGGKSTTMEMSEAIKEKIEF